MRFLKVTPALLLFCTYFTSVSQAQYKPNLDRYTLDNGLTVILNYDPDQVGVFGAVGVKVGSKDDPADATGMAHYQEHMLFKGTTELGTLDWEKEKPFIDSIFMMYDELGKTKDEEERAKIQEKINHYSVKANEYAVPNEFSNLIKSIGGTGLNAFTSPDMTVYHNAFPSNQMEKWLELYSHRFINPVFRGFQSELEVVYEEYNMRSDIFISPLLDEFNKTLFKNHPYGTQTTIGTVEHLKSPSLTKMYEFFETYYVANNMILVISGNFDVKATKPLIEKKFSRLRTGEVEPLKEFKEAPFNGRELVEVKMSPIKLGGLAFRTVPYGHPDALKLDVLNAMLNNEAGSGLLDQLSTDNELLGAFMAPMPYHDHGANLVIFIPKLVGQKLEEAEQLIIDQIKKLHKGDFEDWRLQSAKNSLYMREQRSLESKEAVALSLIEAEMLGIKLESVFSAGEEIKSITKEELMELAKKYYGDNYLAFFSKMSLKQNKERVTKPNYEPVIPNKDTTSQFADAFDKIPSGKPVINFIDFEKDIVRNKTLNGNPIYMSKNPKNDIFSLRLEYEVGSHEMPILNYAANLLSSAGTQDIEAKALLDSFNYYSCSFSAFPRENSTVITLEGMEENLEKVLPFVNDLLHKPKFTEKNKKTLLQGERATRLLESRIGDILADALVQYMRYGENSDYIDRLSVKDVKKMELETMEEAVTKINDYACNIHYVGKKDINKLRMALDLHMEWSGDPKKGELDYLKPTIQYDKNTVYFTKKKSAKQSKIFIMSNDIEYTPAMSSAVSGFNLYFGGDFSGLILQEIREYRSLAYSAGGYVSKPGYPQHPAYFMGFIGTQADKSNEAIEVFYDLINDMPHKEDRLEMIRQYLINKAQNDQPTFRYITRSVQSWERSGYTEDPRKKLLAEYKKLSFEDIVQFYETSFKTNIFSMAIMGDKREIDLEALEEYGTVVQVKKRKLFSK